MHEVGGMVSGKTAFVTGAGSGIGRAIAERLAVEGASGILLADLDAGALAETAQSLAGLECEVLTRRVDVGDPGAAAEAVAVAVGAWDRLDCAVNNAGISGPRQPLDQYTDEQWRQVLAVNLDGVFFCMRAELSAMLTTGGGAIVNISSGAAVHPPPGLAPYTASKAALIGLTRAVAGEYARQGIRVNCVLPGPTRTPLWESNLGPHPDERRRVIEARSAMGRIGDPSEVAEAVVWLCSIRSSYVHGVDLLVDGGEHAFSRG
jgi:NAD(P)-dependent dehydrogenase (short-subunit alcohol dehydrogenase family)